MLKVTLDENNYVNGWCMVGDNGGVDVEPPEDLDGFMECFTGYKVVDGNLVLDEEKDASDKLDARREELRNIREVECFPVINRGWFWYLSLTLAQWREFCDQPYHNRHLSNVLQRHLESQQISPCRLDILLLHHLRKLRRNER